MQTRPLGRSGLSVPPIMLGGNVFGWTVDEAASFRLLDRAVELGLTFIDTADVYSRWVPGHRGGESETILGRWLQRSGKRAQVTLATKVGMELGDGAKGLSASYIERAAEASLQRLQTDHIDLYQSHRDDPDAPLTETLSAYAKLIAAGKVRIIGASNYSGARLREALEISRREGLPAYQTLQPHYNLVERRTYEHDLAPMAAEYKLGVIPYFALAAGFLTGKYRSAADVQGKARAGAVGKYLNERGLSVLRALEEVAEEARSTPARAALAWLLAKPDISAPIASATREEHLLDLAAAAQLKLSPEAVAKLDRASA